MSDILRPLTAAERVHVDVIEALNRARVCVSSSVVTTALERFLARYGETQNAKVSLNTAYVKAVGLTLKKHPTLQTLRRQYTWVQPGTADVGISVGGEASLAPVVIVQDPASKSLAALAAEIREKARQVLKQEKADLERLSKWTGWIPNGIRRSLIRWMFRRQQTKRQFSGCFQVSNLDSFDIEWACTPVTGATLLMIGARIVKPVVVDQAVEIHPTIQIVLTGDHDTLNGRTGGEFLKEFNRICQHPEELQDPA